MISISETAFAPLEAEARLLKSGIQRAHARGPAIRLSGRARAQVLERNDLEKLDTAGKLDAIAKAALDYDVTFDMMTYSEGLERVGKVRDPGENRPV